LHELTRGAGGGNHAKPQSRRGREWESGEKPDSIFKTLAWIIHEIVVKNTYLSENINGAIEKSYAE
jgi:hypothetical protein